MKYVIRAVKYFIYIAVLASLMLTILVLWQGTAFDIDTLFVQGMTSVYKILGLFAAISAIYPAISYQKRTVNHPGSWDEDKKRIIRILEDRKYSVERDNAGELTFVASGNFTRALRMFEDRITMNETGGVILVEGHRKDLARILPAIEQEFRDRQ